MDSDGLPIIFSPSPPAVELKPYGVDEWRTYIDDVEFVRFIESITPKHPSLLNTQQQRHLHLFLHHMMQAYDQFRLLDH